MFHRCLATLLLYLLLPSLQNYPGRSGAPNPESRISSNLRTSLPIVYQFGTIGTPSGILSSGRKTLAQELAERRKPRSLVDFFDDDAEVAALSWLFDHLTTADETPPVVTPVTVVYGSGFEAAEFSGSKNESAADYLSSLFPLFGTT